MSLPSRPTVVAREISKTYKVARSKSRLVGSLFPGGRMEVKALLPASFVSYEGEAIGILGRNGSGKSTLLRILAGNERPDTGEVLVSSRPSLLGVTAALQPKLSGRQNIRLGLLAMGMSAGEVDDLTPEVAELSALEESLDRPMNTYSSGMQARLSFAIATSRNPEILMIDEALGTGDATFAETAKQRMDALLSSAGTVFMVSHSAASLRRTCKRALWIHDGEIIADGDLSTISSSYAKWGEFTTQKQFSLADDVIDEVRSSYIPPSLVFDSEAREFGGDDYSSVLQ